MMERVWHLSYPGHFLVEISTLNGKTLSMGERCPECGGAIDWSGVATLYKLTCVSCGRQLTQQSRGIGLTQPIYVEPDDVWGHPDDKRLVLNRLHRRLEEMGVNPLTAHLIELDFVEVFTQIVLSPDLLPATVGELHIVKDLRPVAPGMLHG